MKCNYGWQLCLQSTIQIIGKTAHRYVFLIYVTIFYSAAVESDEAEQDDLVPDCEVRAKGFHMVPTPPVPEAGRQPQDPQIAKLAQQMQQAGDALYKRYGDRVDVRLF